ncbi:hypothetical protein HRbin04_00087 [archaeon HR04]|nr:hypothetical protein HRbin04_00087 [archaeon HR04]
MDLAQLWEIINSSNSSISLIIIPIITALFYYFGRIINSVEAKQLRTADYYILGMLFTITYIIFPILFIIMSNLPSIREIYSSLPSFILDWHFVVIVVIGVGFLLVRLHTYLEKHKPLTTTNKLIKILQRYYPYILFIPAIITIWSVYSYITPANIFQPTTIVLFIGEFAILSWLARIFGYLNTEYPQVRIVLEDKNEINGILLKWGKYVTLQHNGSELLINKDKIIRIEYMNDKKKDNNKQSIIS